VAVEFDSYISADTIRDARRLIEDRGLAAEWAETNYALARRHFSFTVLDRRLDALLSECFGDAP
jgi:hypothetical protein